VTGVHIKGRTQEGGGTSPRWTITVKPSSAGYTQGLEPGHSGSAKPAKATEVQAPCVGEHVFCLLVSLHPRCSILTNLTECPLQRERVAVFLHVGTKATIDNNIGKMI